MDEVKLKEKGRAFHDLFLTKVSITSVFYFRGVILYISAAKCKYLICLGGLLYLNLEKSWNENRLHESFRTCLVFG